MHKIEKISNGYFIVVNRITGRVLKITDINPGCGGTIVRYIAFKKRNDAERIIMKLHPLQSIMSWKSFIRSKVYRFVYIVNVKDMRIKKNSSNRWNKACLTSDIMGCLILAIMFLTIFLKIIFSI